MKKLLPLCLALCATACAHLDEPAGGHHATSSNSTGTASSAVTQPGGESAAYDTEADRAHATGTSSCDCEDESALTNAGKFLVGLAGATLLVLSIIAELVIISTY